ncbi:putative protease [Rhodoblastus acidophilus]|uniref:peptidase U32 family protein n=1 Tax=Rhodoblastus acidophilus TaxID=1074 RepID=UPI002224F09E|nr:U32 family peptidase [Rhodoblastus acidophilus]MCW2318631.1 putative protease [Rhodoblastus acidophilus]
MFELSTNVASPQQLRRGDFSAYDALYLGEFSCLNYPNNFCAHPEFLAEAAAQVHAMGKKAYLRLFAVPSNHDLPTVRNVIKTALALPFDAFEVHNLGLLQMLKEMGNTKPIHLGVFGNLYTDATACVVKDYGVTRVYPNPELSLDEAIYIRDNTPIDVLIPVHGKIPLVVAETCFIHETSGGLPGEDCKFKCAQEHWLTRASGDWSLKDTGCMTLSGADLCMLEHVEKLAAAKLGAFYVQSHGESPEYIATVGRIYRDALIRAFAGAAEGDVRPQLEQLSGLAKMGLCNGYYFGDAGRRYVGRT